MVEDILCRDGRSKARHRFALLSSTSICRGFATICSGVNAFFGIFPVPFCLQSLYSTDKEIPGQVNLSGLFCISWFRKTWGLRCYIHLWIVTEVVHNRPAFHNDSDGEFVAVNTILDWSVRDHV